MTLKVSRYTIYTIGKTRKKWIKEGICSYLKRLPGLTIKELRESNQRKEALAIKTASIKDEILIALSEEGESLTSTQLLEKLNQFESKRIAFAIGGADGLDRQVKESANVLLGLSHMTFPHEIALLLLIEQIYRAQSISQGTPYHRK